MNCYVITFLLQIVLEKIIALVVIKIIIIYAITKTMWRTTSAGTYRLNPLKVEDCIVFAGVHNIIQNIILYTLLFISVIYSYRFKTSQRLSRWDRLWTTLHTNPFVFTRSFNVHSGHRAHSVTTFTNWDSPQSENKSSRIRFRFQYGKWIVYVRFLYTFK